MPRMKLVIPEMDSAPKAGQKREITCKLLYFHYDNYWSSKIFKILYSSLYKHLYRLQINTNVI